MQSLNKTYMDYWFPTPIMKIEAQELLPDARSIFADTDFGNFSLAHYVNGSTTYSALGAQVFNAHPGSQSILAAIKEVAQGFAQSQGVSALTHEAIVTEIWISRMNKGGSHPRHVHGGAQLCGTLYVDAPEGAGKIRFHNPATPVMRFCELPVTDPNNPLTWKWIEYEPVPGMMLLWNGWLAHEVMPNPAEGNRDAISFNINFAEKAHA